ncbi:rhodanese-like domain-containing protein [Candidatus Woesearchaeota archaeon]|nr:rhodanese-like domain-containing protein [Candidatus Woesearchaeota archaeon]
MQKKAEERGKGLREAFHLREEISPQELKKEKKKYKLVDVREEWEFDDSHIEGAENIPFSVFEWAEREGKIIKDKPIVVYCLHGIRSKRVVDFLKTKCYKNICHLTGGYEAWLNNQ